MDQKQVTLIVSDLHMGDGSAGDDFVDDQQQFANFVRAQAATAEGRAGRIELIINGDFLEMVQVLPEAYQGDGSLYWCSESESVRKLDRIVAGHPAVFDALKEFQLLKNQVTLFPGNHDVDLHWPAVRNKLQQRIPGINIEIDSITYKRYGGRLQIAHGHLFPTIDPANGFTNWQNPILTGANPPRLEMCPGTLFMIKFVNLMEAKYPFADNLSPVTALVGILAREDRWGLTALAWMLARFAVQHSVVFLSSAGKSVPVGKQLVDVIQDDKILRQNIAALYGELLGKPGVTEADVKRDLATEDAVAGLIEQLFRADPTLDKWPSVFGRAKPGISSSKKPGSGVLSIVQSGNTDARAGCITVAQGHWNAGAQVVVFGHTHLPQTEGSGAQRYYNPGSWTRYVESTSDMTLARLEDESKFPYQLNCVRVEDSGDKVLKSEMISVEKRAGA
jgi:UDP-2,3-diacylglucosamine pyrophosphatase LpxH